LVAASKFSREELPDRSLMAELIARVGNSKGTDFSVCDVEVPVRIGPAASPRDDH
jgi:hypothetical protein